MSINWVVIQSVANAALVLTSGGAIAYAGRQLRHERAYRSVDNLEKQLTFFLSEGFVEARRRLASMRVREGDLVAWHMHDPPIAAFEVLDFYDHLALLVKKGHLDIFDVWHTFYEWAQPVYVDLQMLIEDPQSDYKDHYCELKHLMRRMDNIQIKRMYARNENHWALWTAERILDHYRYEIDAGEALRRDRRRKRRLVKAIHDEQVGPEKSAEAMEGAFAGRK